MSAEHSTEGVWTGGGRSNGTVWKVGGSLFDLPDLGPRLSRLLHGWGEPVLLVPGGGPTADLIRRWQPRHGLSEEQAHWLALSAMQLNAELLAALLPGSQTVSTREEVAACWSRGGIPILRAEAFCRREEARAPQPLLPHDWSVTSDSLAVWVAGRVGCERVVLLKSCPLPRDCTAGEASAAGLVDGYFPRISETVAIDWCHLRAAQPEVCAWLRRG